MSWRLFGITTVSHLLVVVISSLTRLYDLPALLSLILAFHCIFHYNELALRSYLLQGGISIFYIIGQCIVCYVFGFPPPIEENIIWKGLVLAQIIVSLSTTIFGFIVAYSLIPDKDGV